MMSGLRKTGYTNKTSKRYIINAATVYTGLKFEDGKFTGDLHGATSGGVTLTIEQEYRDIEVDGTGHVKVKDNKVLAIFPEGTRSKTGKLGKAEPGALMMASKAMATIVPCCVIGTDFQRQGRIWPKVTVRFGKPIYFPADAVVNKEFLHDMTENLMQHIAALQAGEKV